MLRSDEVDALIRQRTRLVRALASWVGSRQDAEDVVQEAFARALARGVSLRHQEKAAAWFARLLRNLAIDHLRRRRAKRRVEKLLREDPAFCPAIESLQSAVCRCIDGIVPTMRSEYARVLRRVDLDGARVADVARELSISENNLRVRLHRARSTLKARLLLVCGLCAEETACLACICDGSAPEPSSHSFKERRKGSGERAVTRDRSDRRHAPPRPQARRRV